MLGKGKKPEDSQQSKTNDKKAQLVDFSVIKDWFDYSHNRTMSGLKLANAADIKAAEMERDAKKQGRDWNQIVMIIAVICIVGVIAFMLIMQFGNITEISNDLASCKGAKAECDGRLNVCNDQLEELQPVAREIAPEINI